MKTWLKVSSYVACLTVLSALAAFNHVALASEGEVIVPVSAPVKSSSILKFLYEKGNEYFYQVPDGRIAVAARTGGVLSNMPDYDWWYGCSPTSAGMMMGFYDRGGFPNMVAGGDAELTSFGVSAPLANAAIASAGHINDFWKGYGQIGNDPHPNGTHTFDSLADFMGTSRDVCESSDGSTWWWSWNDGSPWTPTNSVEYEIDGCEGIYGIYDYARSRGYSSQNVKHQPIYNATSAPNGMTLAQYQAEINAGRPVGINITGHTMMGYGYSGSTLYVNDTWSSPEHTMTWGGIYSGSRHRSCFTFTPMSGDWETAYDVMAIAEDELDLLRDYREEILERTSAGELYTRILYQSSEEALEVLERNSELLAVVGRILNDNLQGVEDVLNGEAATLYGTDEVISFLDMYMKRAPLELKLLAAAVKKEIVSARRSGQPFLGFEVH